MGIKKNLHKYTLLFIVTSVFVAPHVQKQFSIFQSKPLHGYISPISEGDLRVGDWFSGVYQDKKNETLNYSFGFRSDLVRFYNECMFRLFNKSSSSHLIVGKEDYLFEEWYINAYTGQDFLGSDSIYKKLVKLRYIEDTLSSMGKTLITVYAPGKASFFSEYIPKNYLIYAKDSNNIDSYLRLSKELGLRYIDFRTYFNNQKGRHPYPLYPKNGTHWSYYGMCIAADSLIRHIEGSRKINMPNPFWTKTELDQEREYDYDIARTMNLYSTINGNTMGYPNIKVESDSTLTRPKTLVIADSYYWGMFNFNIAKSFENNTFWYYNKHIYPESYKEPLLVKNMDLKSEISEFDVVVIMCTEGNLSRFGWGFVDQYYSALFEQ